jgi:hypothetical protein
VDEPPELAEPSPDPELVADPPDPELTAEPPESEPLAEPPDPLEDPAAAAWDLCGLFRCVDFSGLRLGSMPKSVTALIFSFKSPRAFWSSSVAVCWTAEAPTPPGTIASRGGESSTVNR